MNKKKRQMLLSPEILVLENRIRDGEGKITDQNKRVREAEKAVEILEKDEDWQGSV